MGSACSMTGIDEIMLNNYVINIMQLFNDLRIAEKNCKTPRDIDILLQFQRSFPISSNVSFYKYPAQLQELSKHYLLNNSVTISEYSNTVYAHQEIKKEYPKYAEINIDANDYNKLKIMVLGNRCVKCNELFCVCHKQFNLVI